MEATACQADAATEQQTEGSDGPTPLEACKLMEVAEEIYGTFNSARQTMDSHVDAVVHQKRIAHPDDRSFLKEAMYGLVRYAAAIKAFLAVFFHQCRTTAQRKHRNLYSIYTYLVFFQLSHLGADKLAQLIQLKNAQTMLVWLDFMLQTDHLQSSIRAEWLKLYSDDFVDCLLSSFWTHQAALSGLLSKLNAQVFLAQQQGEGAAEDKPCKRRVTRPQPFQITAPKPRLLPVEEALPEQIKARPCPHLSAQSQLEQRIKAAKQANKAAQQTKYPLLGKAMELRTQQRPGVSRIEHVRAELAALEADTMRPCERRRSVPAVPEVEVRRTAASVLRENKVHSRSQAKEEEALKRFEQELHDDRQFVEWQQRTQALDNENNREERELRRIEARLARSAAIQATADQVCLKQVGRAAARSEAAVAAGSLKDELARLRAGNAAKKRQVQEERRMMHEALERLQQERAADANEVRERVDAGLREAAEAAEQQRLERAEIIKRLRAMEQAPHDRAAVFDPAQPAGHGLLDEMSLAELRQRLKEAQERQARDTEAKRSSILKAKSTNAEELKRMEAHLQQIRGRAKAQRLQRRAQSAQEAREAQAAAAAAAAEGQKTMETRMEAKRAKLAAARAELAESEKQRRFWKQQDASGAAQKEIARWQDLRAGMEKSMQQRQRGALDTYGDKEGLAERAKHIRQDHVAAAHNERLRQRAHFDQQLQHARLKRAQEATCDDARKSGLVQKQRDFERAQREKRTAVAYVPNRERESVGARIAHFKAKNSGQVAETES